MGNQRQDDPNRNQSSQQQGGGPQSDRQQGGGQGSNRQQEQQGQRGRPSTMNDDKVSQGDLDAGEVGSNESTQGSREDREKSGSRSDKS
jgi:hypothetical protein